MLSSKKEEKKKRAQKKEKRSNCLVMTRGLYFPLSFTSVRSGKFWFSTDNSTLKVFQLSYLTQNKPWEYLEVKMKRNVAC